MSWGNELLTVAQAYQSDREAESTGIRGLDLMESAGGAVARFIQGRWSPRPISVLCGPGNNGGDGFVVARLLRESGWDVRLSLIGSEQSAQGDALENLKRWKEIGQKIYPLDVTDIDERALVVDAMFGAGLNRPLEGAAKLIVEKINKENKTCIAVDILSGVNGDTGEVIGSSGAAPKCAATITFFRPKPGHFLYPGREFRGSLRVADIGIPETALNSISPKFRVNDPSLWSLPQHSWNDHKYRRGHGVVFGGSKVTGAARLAGRGARRAGPAF